MKSNVFQLSFGLKKFIEASCTNNIRTGEKVFTTATFKGL